MCGIGGQVRFDDKNVKPILLEKIGEAIEHRGRDNAGYYCKKNIGLVHRRLSIIDLTNSANQPMFIENGQIGITFNGEIFNYLELRQLLIQKGYHIHTNSDTEVLLKSYVEYGIEFLDKIDGMFAFALVDFQKKKLFLVRDRLGIKPLYYYLDSNSIIFASEIKGIIKSGEYSSAIDYLGLCEYLHMQLYTGNNTFFKGIKTVEPGHYIVLDLCEYTVEIIKYWDMPQDEIDISYEDAVEQLRNYIDKAVLLWSRADVPIAAYISGGLDSSSVATLAKKHLNKKIQSNLTTFSSIYPEAQFPDERPYSDAVASAIQSDHYRVILPKEDVIKAHDDLLYVLDMPIAGYSAPYRIMSRMVRKSNKVVLTGHGGDEFFCGYPKYIAAALSKEISNNLSSSGEINSQNIKYLIGFENQARQIIGQCLFKDDRHIIKALFYRSEHLWNYVNPDISKEVKDYDVSDSLMQTFANRNTGFLKKLLYLDIKTLLPGLLHVEDRTSMIENLESRTPLLDRKIIEFASRIPERYLLRDGLKGMIRKAMGPILPTIVTVNPSKSGTMYPASELFDRELKNRVDQDLSILDNSGLFTKPVKHILGESQELINKRVTWALWSLGAWMRAFG